MILIEYNQHGSLSYTNPLPSNTFGLYLQDGEFSHFHNYNFFYDNYGLTLKRFSIDTDDGNSLYFNRKHYNRRL